MFFFRREAGGEELGGHVGLFAGPVPWWGAFPVRVLPGKLRRTVSIRWSRSMEMSTNTYIQGREVTSTGTRHEWP